MNWIDGEWLDSGDHADSFDPATGEVIGRYANGGRDEAKRGVAAASRAFRQSEWKDDRTLRSRVLNQLADRFEARGQELIGMLMLENGKVRAEAEFEVSMVPSKLRYWAAAVLTDYGRAAELAPGRLSVVVRQPISVAGIVAPFNSPVILTIRSLRPRSRRPAPR